MIVAQLVILAEARNTNALLRRRDAPSFKSIVQLLCEWPNRAESLHECDKVFNYWMVVQELVLLYDMYKNIIKAGATINYFYLFFYLFLSNFFFFFKFLPVIFH